DDSWRSHPRSCSRWDDTVHRIFLLSPASCSGKRADLLLNDRARFDLALRLREPPGAPLGDVFSFLSGLYFRGKLAYARAFARPPRRLPGVFVITTSRGLVLPEQPATIADLREFAAVDLHAANARYRAPLTRDAAWLAERIGPRAEIVLLGSVASGKYIDVLGETFGARLRFPGAFVGRGDMSRGGLMLRCVREGRELDYVGVAGSERHGPRPPRLAPARRVR
ncbi:MAG TPA: hypothetical protein VKA21_12700, partial [Candidatus Binatia bacterium]|nr:hypothetical protein [Candidatus Binatia bacterium]